MKIPHELKSQYYTILNMTGAFHSCFKPLVIGMENVSDPTRYYYDGSIRDFDEPHTIFQYTISGTGGIRWQSTEYDVPAGHAFFCNSHDPDIAYYYPEEGQENWKLLFVTFDKMSEIADEMLQRFGPVYRIDEQSECIKQIKGYLYRPDEFLEFKPSHGFRLASMVISALFESVIEWKETGVHSQIVNGAIDYILTNIDKAISVEMVADYLDISREHLTRVFQKELDLTPLYYINITKMRHVGKLLRTTNLNIKEIACAIGYDNTSHFARLFRRITGMSPSEFRSVKGRPIF